MSVNRISHATMNVEGLNLDLVRHDGASPHYAFGVRNILNHTFKNKSEYLSY